MTDPWFSSEIARWFPFLSFLAFLAGLELYAQRGVYRRPVFATGIAATILGGVMVIAGIAGLIAGQPRFVTGPLLIAGFVIAVVCAGGLVRLRQLYAAAELRKMTAEDL